MGITRQQALDCFASDDLIGIGMEADALRRRLHPEGVVTYTIAQAISAGDQHAVLAQIEAAEERGALGIFLQPAASDDLASLASLLGAIRRRFPGLVVEGLAAEAAHLAQTAHLSLEETIARLHDAGLDTLGDPTPQPVTDAWLRLHSAAHAAGMRTSARIVFGAGESLEQRLDALDAISALQQRTGGFAAVAPVSFHAPGGRELDETTAVEYLKTLAVTRLFLDAIDTVQSDWTTQGLKVLQMGLRFGANDVGAITPSGSGKATEEELRRLIRDAGFRPAQRDLAHRSMMLA